MVRIQSELKRFVLRFTVEDAKAAGNTLREQLLAEGKLLRQPSLRQGKQIISTSGSGQSASIQIPQQWTQVSPENQMALLEEFFEVLDAVIALGTPDASDSAGLDTLYTAMVDDDRLRGIRQQHGDFSGLNYPATSVR